MKSDIGTNNKGPSMSKEQQVNKGAVISLQNNQSRETKKVRFADDLGTQLVNVIYIDAHDNSAIDRFLQPDIFHTGDKRNQERLFKSVRTLTDEKAQSYKHCFIKRFFSDTCKKEHAIYKAYQYMKNNITINENDEIVGLEKLRQQTLNIIDQWNACCGV